MSESQPTPEEVRKPILNLDRESVDVVQAEMVRINQSAIQEVTAEEAGLTMSASLNTKAMKVITHESALFLVDADKVEMTNSAAGAVIAENIDVSGQTGIVLGNSVELGNTYAGFVAGGNIRAEKIDSLVFLGRHVEGNVQAVVDTRGALIAGMVGGLFAGLIVLVGRFALRQK